MSAASHRWYRGSRKSETGFLEVLQSKCRVSSVRREQKWTGLINALTIPELLLCFHRHFNVVHLGESTNLSTAAIPSRAKSEGRNNNRGQQPRAQAGRIDFCEAAQQTLKMFGVRLDSVAASVKR